MFFNWCMFVNIVSVSEHVESLCIWFCFLVLWLWIECCVGCGGFTHPLGGKRSLRVKGLVGLNIEVEKYFSWRGDSFHGVWAPLKPYAFLLFYGSYK